MSDLIDPDEPLSELEQSAIDERSPPHWVPEPELEQTARSIIAASTNYDEILPF